MNLCTIAVGVGSKMGTVLSVKVSLFVVITRSPVARLSIAQALSSCHVAPHSEDNVYDFSVHCYTQSACAGPCHVAERDALLLRLLHMKQASALDEKDTGAEDTPGV